MHNWENHPPSLPRTQADHGNQKKEERIFEVNRRFVFGIKKILEF